MAKMWRNTISADQHLNTYWNLKFQPRQNPNSHLKFLFQFKLRLYLKYNLTFKYGIKLEVLSQFKRQCCLLPIAFKLAQTSSLISYLNVELYFKYSHSLNWNRNFKCEFGFCLGWNFKFWHVFKCWSALIVFLPILAIAHTYNIASHLK